MLEALAESGIAGDALIPGTGCCAIPDTVALTRKAVEIGAAPQFVFDRYIIDNHWAIKYKNDNPKSNHYEDPSRWPPAEHPP